VEVEYYSTTDPEIKGLNIKGSSGRKCEREKCCSYLCFDIQKEVLIISLQSGFCRISGKKTL
jgi:hypothetical protein